MFMNVSNMTLDVTASSTPTAYPIPTGATRVRIVNGAGADAILKGETNATGAATSTLVAPVIGTPYNGARMLTGTVETFNINPANTHISVYSATGTGTVSLQFGHGQ